jgi:hypothetical protein
VVFFYLEATGPIHLDCQIYVYIVICTFPYYLLDTGKAAGTADSVSFLIPTICAFFSSCSPTL